MYMNSSQCFVAIQGKLAEADHLYLRAIQIGEKKLGADHPALATWLNNRAGLLHAQVRATQKIEDCLWNRVDAVHRNGRLCFRLREEPQKYSSTAG